MLKKVRELLDEARESVEAVASNQPTAESVEQVIGCARRLCDRGVPARVLYSDAVREDPLLLDPVRQLPALGVEVGTLPSLPARVLLVDRRRAFVLADPEEARDRAVVTQSAGVVTPLSWLFELMWADARGVDEPPHDPPEEEQLSVNERELLRLLAEGNTDEGVARQLQVSPRTVRRMLADLSERAGARSRFELAARSVSRGWLTLP